MASIKENLKKVEDMEIDIVDRIRQLDEEREKLLEEARTPALEAARKAVERLNSLGYNYVLAERSETGTIKREQKDAPCSICNFKTLPLHDARRHRGQKQKHPFGIEELMALGLSKVE